MNRKIEKVLLIFSLLIAVSSCNPVPPEPGFDVSLRSNSVLLIDAGSVSCTGQVTGSSTTDRSALSFSFRGLNIDYTGNSSSIDVQYVTISLYGSSFGGGRYDCMVATEELGACWYGVSPSPSVATIIANSGVNSNSLGFKCGGVPIADKTRNYTGSGKVTIYAIGQINNEDVPYSFSNNITWRFIGIP